MNAARKEDVKRWIEEAKERRATHVIVVVDTFDYEDFPCYISKGQDVNEKIKYYSKNNGTRVVEVYNMSMDIESQLNEWRAYHV